MPAPTYRLPADGYLFLADADGRDYRMVPNDDWGITIPIPSDREGATLQGFRKIDDCRCAVFHVGGGAAPDVFLACSEVAARVAP